jgi:TPR repeat protein
MKKKFADAFEYITIEKRPKLILVRRHGWGCEPDVAKAVHYLSIAAANAAEVENLALKAGLKKGGAAKGELVLAMFELANCFRQGWGVPKDPVAAKNVGSPTL